MTIDFVLVSEATFVVMAFVTDAFDMVSFVTIVFDMVSFFTIVFVMVPFVAVTLDVAAFVLVAAATFVVMTFFTVVAFAFDVVATVGAGAGGCWGCVTVMSKSNKSIRHGIIVHNTILTKA